MVNREWYDISKTKIFMTTENLSLALKDDGGTMTPSIDVVQLDDSTGVPKLGTTIPGTADSYGEYPAQIVDVTGIEVSPERETDTISLLDGRSEDHDFVIRPRFEISISKRATSPIFARMFDQCRFGTNGDELDDADTSVIYNGKKLLGDNGGYRIYIMKGDGTFEMYYNCKFTSDGYSKTTSRNEVNSEELKLVTYFSKRGATTADVSSFSRSLFGSTPPSKY